MNKRTLPKKTILAINVVIVLLILGCQVFSSSSATSTQEPIPLSDVDLSWAAIRLDELPAKLDLIPSENLSKPEDMQDIYPDYEMVHTNVVKAQYTSFSTEDRRLFYSNGIFVYADTSDAIQAFEQISGGWTVEPETVSNLGNDALALNMESDLLPKITILWHYQEVLVYLTILSRDPLELSINQVIANARNVQSRLEQRTP